MQLFSYDKQFLESNATILAGADEAGRGCLAGPVVAGIVVFPPNFSNQNILSELNDSKKLSKTTRENLANLITINALAYEISFVSEQIIDEINILNATKLAMQNAASKILQKLQINTLLIDGNFRLQLPKNIKQKSIIQGDSKSAVIAASSILAKVARDEYMSKIDKNFPDYKFKEHKGYGTKKHLDLLKTFGPCEIHRKTFFPVSKFFDKQLELI